MRPLYFYVIAAMLAALSSPACAERTEPVSAPNHELTAAERLSLAREFVSRVSGKLKDADTYLRAAGRKEEDFSQIPDGETLFFRIKLDRRLALEAPVLALVERGGLLVSLRDFVTALQFPITVSPEGKKAEGWYIRESRTFTLDFDQKRVESADNVYEISDGVRVEDSDVLVPIRELEKWFGVELTPDSSQLELALVSPVKLPVQEQMDRRKRTFGGETIGPPVLPERDIPRKAIDFPFVDVSTNSDYTRMGNGEKPELRQTASVQTSGDFAYGTLFTSSQFDREEKLTNLRANYKKEIRDAELLGPLKARRYEIGDVFAPDIPLNEGRTSGMGFRVTNADRIRNILRPSTEITGNGIPGWDVELYREDQLLAFQTVSDDGTYRFDDVSLFSTNNNFRLVFYGPQGEVREEDAYVPVDPSRLSQMESAYDISVYRQNTLTYRKQDVRDLDEGAPNIAAYYEKPVTENTAISAGFSNRQDNKEQKARLYGGVSTSLFDTLLNFNTAVDSKGEAAAELVARKDIGDHDLRNETRLSTEKYRILETDDVEDINAFTSFTNGNTTDGEEIFGNEFSVSGPLAIGPGRKPRYNLALDYSQKADGENSLNSTAGFSTSWSPLSLSQQFSYQMASDVEEDKLNSITNLNGRIGLNRVRLTADYEVRPESQLERVAANVTRRITPKAEIDLGVRRQMDTKLTEGRAQVNWDAGFARITPGISYNTDRDLIATLNTRFGLARDPSSGKIRAFDRQITSNGGVSAFVYLDKDGNNQFNEGDEPISDAIVKAPQNGGREITDEEGYAFFRSMGSMRLTDVFVDPDSLPDPYWISGYQGASVLPREGHIVPLEFPVHISGEIDGTVYARAQDGSAQPMRSVRLGLYDGNGKKVMGAVSESDGFYLFSKIPPGSYYLNVDETALPEDMARPLPQPVHIGFEGTTVYGNGIYLKEGTTDVPISILAEAPEEKTGSPFRINLGAYKSRLSMGLAWFKARTMAGFLVQESDLLQKPSESYPEKEGNYVLRLASQAADLKEAYQTCAQIRKRSGVVCGIEVLPGGLEQKVAAK
jgi:hypothetical protein